MHSHGSTALDMMRSFGLGIIDSDLGEISLVETEEEMLSSDSLCETDEIANRVKGSILLQVEQHGEAWYVHPEKCRRIYMEDGNSAYEIMRYLSLGISKSDLEKMPTGEIK